MRKLAVLSALVISSAVAAHAESINGYFSANGSDSFTSNSITFQNPGSVGGAIGGTFANYLVDGGNVNFLNGTLPYHNGVNTPPASVYPTGIVPIFTAVGTNGTTFTFEMNEYNAGYTANSTSAESGCNIGSTCLSVTGMGYFTSSDSSLTDSGPATFSFTSQYVAGQPTTVTTTFSASTAATAAAVTPEPSSLALMGTGLLGTVGVMRRKFAR